MSTALKKKRKIEPKVCRRTDFAHLPPYKVVADEDTTVDFPDYPAIARGYCEAVLSGSQPACNLIHLACQRYLDMLVMAEDPENLWYFSPKHVIDYCNVSENLTHPEAGGWIHTQEDDRIVLEPCQIFCESAIHGFRFRKTDERVVSRALEVWPRKSAKSERMGGAVAYHLLFAGDKSPQIVIGASTREQTNRIYKPAQLMISKEPDLVDQFDIRFTKVGAQSRANDGEIILLSSQGEKQDGFNPSLALMEELHAQNPTVYEVIRSAFGARPNALMRMITTAGYHPSGLGYSVYREAVQMLTTPSGLKDYSFFAFIATLDDDDYIDPDTNEMFIDKLLTDQSLMMKANPMWGISIDPVKIMQQADEAKRSPDKRGEFLRTRYNIWSGAGKSLVDAMQYSGCVDTKMRLEHYVGQKCWIGVDLASQLDMCAIGFVFENPDNTISIFAQHYLATGSPTFLDRENFNTFHAWADAGFLTATSGVMADYDRIEKDLLEYCQAFDVQHIAFDPMQANMLMKSLWDQGIPVGTWANSARTMTAPTDDIISRIPAKRVKHDGNPILAWNFANMYGERKGNGSIMPRKETPESNRKIDGAVAVIFANGIRMLPTELKVDEKEMPKRRVYEKRGLKGHG